MLYAICLLLVKPLSTYIEHKEHVSKVIDVFQRTCSCLLDTWKKNIEIQVPISFFVLSNLLTQTCLYFHTTGQLTSSEHAICRLHVLLHLFVSLCNILYFDAAQFSLKRFSLSSFHYILTVSVVRQQNEYEIVTETRPIKTTGASQ